ncbi:MAG: CheR family methyltransferase [Agriterribacter sp.]
MLKELLNLYGYDFTSYSKASLKRRLDRVYSLYNFQSFNDFFERIKSDPDFFKVLVEEVTVNVTEMLRDPAFYKIIRETVLPDLATYPFIRIWHAGCSTGEEVYSMAILLEEAQLLHKSLLYATDINPRVIEKARRGIFPVSLMQKYSDNYIQSGGKRDFSTYYSANYNLAKFDERLSQRMIFSTHNLVSDHSFNEFQLIFCRNVLIYFEKDLQSKVLTLFDNSLAELGYLALGSKESIKFSPLASRYLQIDKRQKIWRKKK